MEKARHEIAARARNRAVARMIHAHPEEFDRLYHESLQKLQTGAEPVEDSPVKVESAPVHRCQQCETYHADSHLCLNCSTLPVRAIYDEATQRLHNPAKPILVPADMTDEQIKAAVERGKSVRRKYERSEEDDFEEEDDDADVG